MARSTASAAAGPDVGIRAADRLEVAADRGERAEAIGEPDLVPADWHGDGDAQPGVPLLLEARGAVGRDAPTSPVVAVARHPEARAPRIRQMALIVAIGA